MFRRNKKQKKPFIPLRPRVLYIHVDMRFSQLASHPKVQLSILYLCLLRGQGNAVIEKEHSYWRNPNGEWTSQYCY